MLKHSSACGLEGGSVSLFQGQPLSSWPALSLSQLQEPSLSQVYGGAEWEIGKHSFCSVSWGAYILCLRAHLSFPTSRQLICHCQPQQEMGEAEGTCPHPLVPSEQGAAAGWSCPRDGQSHLCRLEWRWLCPYSTPSQAGECWAVLLPQLLLTGWRRCGSRTAVSAQHINTLQIKSHHGRQAQYPQLQSSRLGRGILTRVGSWIWAPQFWCSSASVSCALDLALSTVKPRPQKVNGASNCYWCLIMQREIVRTLQVAFPGMGQSMMRNVVLIVNSDSCWYGSFLHKGHCMPHVPVNIPCSTKLP